MSYAAYREFAERSEFRVEYVDGVVYAVSTGTLDHGTIAGNVFARLRTLTRGTGCRTYSSIVAVRTPRANEYVPDVLVDCMPPGSGVAHATATPCLIVEVLSPSTASADLHEKRLGYQEILTLGAYLVIETDWRAVHRHWRDEAGRWQTKIVGGDGAVPLPCPAGGVLTLAEIYEDVDLPSSPPPPRFPRLRRVREVPAAPA